MCSCSTTFEIPGVASFKTQFFRDFPYASLSTNASATATANTAGQIVAITPVDLGNGYTGAAAVLIIDADDGPGTGATATSNYANGQITSYTITSPGSGYANPVVVVTGGGVNGTNTDYVTDQDILNALTATKANFNQSLPWTDQSVFTYAYLLKAAHFLCLNLKAASQGIRGRGGEWLRNAFAVGDMSSSYTIPERLLRSNIIGPYLETTYGMQYIQIVAPFLVANVRAAIGHTKP